MSRVIVVGLLTLLALARAISGLSETIALKSEGGTFLVPVVINDQITLNFTLDSGAADVSIPADVFSTLVRTGTLQKADYLDTRVYELADGSKSRSQRFRIRSLRVGGVELRNVAASVAPAAGTLLLGQSFLERLGTWSIDNRRHLLVINESGAGGRPADPQPPYATTAPQAPSTGNPNHWGYRRQWNGTFEFNKEDYIDQCKSNTGGTNEDRLRCIRESDAIWNEVHGFHPPPD